jgi:hypothetical protein
MFTDTASSKVTAAHLSRAALLYVRQSTLKQVINNTESAIRQYDLRGRWSPRSPSAGPGSSWAWNAPGWPVTPPTGTSSSSSAG